MELLLTFVALVIIAFAVTGIFKKGKSSSVASEASDYFAVQIKASKADKLIETSQALSDAGIKIEELASFKAELDKI